MLDPEIRLNIAREQSELHIYIEQLAAMTPNEVASLVEELAEIIRELPDVPFSDMNPDNPDLF